MAMFAPSSQSFASPKRKRDSEATAFELPATSSLSRRQNESDLHSASETSDTGSPRSVVASHLEHLEIEDPWIHQLSYQDSGRQRKRFAPMDPEPTLQHSHSSNSQSEQRQSSSLVHGPSPLINESLTHSLSSDHTDLSASTIISPPRARSRSPPLDGDPQDNPMTWHESEITGHSPTDPSDDGYGINGIGFKPTPAMAWARSQKRKQQIADYRSREAKEARQRRTERRRRLSGGSLTDIDGQIRQCKVRFAESDLGQD